MVTVSDLPLAARQHSLLDHGVEPSAEEDAAYLALLDTLRSNYASVDDQLLANAFHFARDKHEGQMRKSGDPYFVHPTRVAQIVADMRMDLPSVCAALLHDVVEDTEVSVDEITKAFGDEIAFLVDSVTKLGRVNFRCKEDQQAESFRKMLLAMARDIRVLVIKLADRLDNMRTLDFMKPEAQERVALETLDIYAPLGARLGMHGLKAELEDLGFKHLFPEAYRSLSRQVKQHSRDSERYIEDVIHRLSSMLAQRGLDAQVQGRVKHLYSIHGKMRRTGCEFDQVHDCIAFRLLMDNVGDCYAALGVVHSQWTPIPGRFKDYVALPKPNMYQSLHTTVMGPRQRRIEVQIRTHEMHQVAEHGIAAHWRYKSSDAPETGRDGQSFAWLRQLLESQQELSDPAEFLDSVKVDLFPDEVYVFTPAGEVKTLPRGATPLDFAYEVHSEVGQHCVGARVNDGIVPLRHKLHNGDVVEILTSPHQQPGKDWLDFVVTSRARSRIRSFLRNEERARSISLGRDLLTRELRKHKMSLGRFTKHPKLNQLLEKLHVSHLDELYSHVGYGRISCQHVIEITQGHLDEKQSQALRPSFIERTVQQVTKRHEAQGILIDGLDNLLVRFGKCCRPLAGDAVYGWITHGRGVTVHRRECLKAMELDPNRRVEVRWTQASNVELPVALQVTTDNRPGILASVSSVFTEHRVNIQEAVCRTQSEGYAINSFVFQVSDVSKLRLLIRAIAKIPGVELVTRQ